MRGQRNYFKITLLISILVAIIFPLDWDTFFLIMMLSSCLTWAIYSMIFLGYVFLVEGRHGRNKSERRNEEDPSFLHSIQEWEALWEISIKRYKDPRMGNQGWN